MLVPPYEVMGNSWCDGSTAENRHELNVLYTSGVMQPSPHGCNKKFVIGGVDLSMYIMCDLFPTKEM